MKPESSVYMTNKCIYELDYYESRSGEYWIGYTKVLIPWVKRYIYPQTFYFKYDEQ